MKRFLLFVFAVAVFLGCLYVWTRHRAVVRQGESYTPASGPVLDAQSVRILSSIDQENTLVVDKVLPSVVSITTLKRVQTGYILDPNEFLLNHRLLPRLQNFTALGSGVIVSKEGHILTNYHVIAGTEQIQVQLNDGRAVPAKIIGADPDTDIAVLQVDATKVTPLVLGNSDDVKVGQVVFAVGNPLGLQGTVTHGIISAKSRVVDDSTLEYFQTDAAINEGNSGGPLVNLRGEVIAINTRVASQTPDHVQPQGLSFAIPSNVARRTMESILKYGHVLHSYLGVEFPPESAQQSANPSGVPIIYVAPDSPAEKAGLKAGDIITKFNGHEISGVRDLHNRVAETPVGSTVAIDIVHEDGKPGSATAHITEQPAGFQSVPNILSGIQVAEIAAIGSPAFPAGLKGVVVTGIDPASPMGKIPGSLRAGDVIEEIEHAPVSSVADFQQVAKQIAPGPRQTLFLVYRGGAHSYIIITSS